MRRALAQVQWKIEQTMRILVLTSVYHNLTKITTKKKLSDVFPTYRVSDLLANKLNRLADKGLYFFIDDRGKVVYCGSTIRCFGQRIREHISQNGSWANFSNLGRFIETHRPDSESWLIVLIPITETISKQELQAIEKSIIRILRPAFNTNAARKYRKGEAYQAASLASGRPVKRYGTKIKPSNKEELF